MNSLIIAVALLGQVQLTETEQVMLDNVNNARAAAGLHKLVPEQVIQEGTRKHALWMATHRSMTHASGHQENIATGQNTCWHVHTTWMNSSGHRAAILRKSVTTIGVSVYRSASGQLYWCMRVR